MPLMKWLDLLLMMHARMDEMMIEATELLDANEGFVPFQDI